MRQAVLLLLLLLPSRQATDTVVITTIIGRQLVQRLGLNTAPGRQKGYKPCVVIPADRPPTALNAALRAPIDSAYAMDRRAIDTMTIVTVSVDSAVVRGDSGFVFLRLLEMDRVADGSFEQQSRVERLKRVESGWQFIDREPYVFSDGRVVRAAPLPEVCQSRPSTGRHE